MEGRWLLFWRIASLFMLLHIKLSSATTYLDYDVASDRVCSRLGKRELSIMTMRPLLVREGGRLLSNWPGSHSFNCRWEVKAKGRGVGVIAVVQKLKFRKLGMECVDYLQFKEDGESNRGPRLCGTMFFGLHLALNGSLPSPPPTPLPPSPPATQSTALTIITSIFKGGFNPWMGVLSRGAVVDPKGELKTYLYVANKAIRSDETLELVIAYSIYQKCDGRNHHPALFHCGYGLCISNLLVNDGVVNCPFGDCIDEGSCASAQASNLTAQILGHSTARRSSGGVSTGVTATSSFFAIAILITIGACICFILRRNKKRRQAEETATEYPQQSGNGEYVGVPTTTGGQSMGPPPGEGPPMMPPGGSAQPMMPPPQGQQPLGGSQIGFYVPGANAPFSSVGTPYPGAGTPYPGAGTPYPPAGTPYPGENAPYPGGNAPYPGGSAPYPGGNAPYPGGNAPYPVQPPPSAPGGDASAPAPVTHESPPPYSALFPQQKN